MPLIARMLVACALATPVTAAASDTLLSRYSGNLSMSNGSSLYVLPDSPTTLGATKFLVWGASNNPALTQPELTLYALDRFGTLTSVRSFHNSIGQSCSASRIIRTTDKGYAMIGSCVFPLHAGSDIGSVVFKVDSNLNPLWSVSLDQSPDALTYFMAKDIKELADGSLAIVSTISSPFPGQFHNYNIAVTLLKPDGTLIWSNGYAIADVRAEGMVIHESADKELYVAGSTQPTGGPKQMLVMKLAPGGARLWSLGYGINATTDGVGYGLASRTSTTSTEEFYAAGYIEVPSWGRGKDIHIVAFDELGNLLSSDTHGTPGDDEARWLASVRPTSGLVDSLFFAGSTDGVGAGLDDAFLLETAGPTSVLDFSVHGGTAADFGREVDVLDRNVYVVGDLVERWSFGNTARRALLMTDQVGPPASRPRCGTNPVLDTKPVAISSNVAKFTTYALPMAMRNVPPLAATSGLVKPMCSALPN